MALLLNQSGDLILGPSGLLTMDFGGIAPSATTAIPSQSFVQNSGDRTIDLTGHFAGTSLTFSLQSAVSGVSIASNILTISDDSALATASVTVLASNAYGSDASQTFSRTVTASGGAWYDDVFGMFLGTTDVGTRVGSHTAASTWAGATSGVSDNNPELAVSGATITANSIDFSSRSVFWTGGNGHIVDCTGVYQTGPRSGAWQINGDNSLIEYTTIDNSGLTGGDPPLYYHATQANGTHIATGVHIKTAPTDCVKAPNSGILQMSWMFFDGYILPASGVHLDMVDMKGADPGSSITDSLFLGNLHPSSPFNASEPSTGMNSAIRCVASDAHGYDGSDRTYERLIIVGSDDVNATATLMSYSSASATGIVFYDVLIDLREHNTMFSAGCRAEDWKVNAIDWGQCVIDGFITVGAEIPYPNLGAHPATAPSTMAAPVITGGSGQFTFAAMTRPWNQRSLITQYDLRYSTDGSSWTTVTDIALTGDSVSVTAGSGYRMQVRAVNGIGAASWSPSSNTVTVS